MNLLENFLDFIDQWKSVFPSVSSFERAKLHALGCLCSQPPHTLTSIIRFKGNESQDWSADYKLYSRCIWNPCDLFTPLIEFSSKYFDKSPCIFAACDDTTIKKTGKHIKTAFYQRDAMSPPFHPNLIWGERFLQISLTLPLYNFDKCQSSRAIPAKFSEAPIVKRPKKKAPPKEWSEYKQLKKKINISLQAKEAIEKFRGEVPCDKELVITTDAAFCNKNFLKNRGVKKTGFICRCRKDIKLCKKNENPTNKRAFYSQIKFTPEMVYKDPTIPWKKCFIFRSGRYRATFYKEIKNVFWQSILNREPIRLCVIKRIPYYARKGHITHRDPAFLLFINTCAVAKTCIQAYFDHNGIELNFKEEKWICGLGQAQIRSDKSVERQPAFVAASYSALILASINTPYLAPLDRWRKKVRRVGVRLFIKELKREIVMQFFAIEDFKPPPNMIKQLFKILL